MSARPMEENTEKTVEEDEFSTGPLSVLTMPVNNNTQAGGESQKAEVVESVDSLKAHLEIVERSLEWISQSESILERINSIFNPNDPSGQELLDIAGVSELIEVVVQYAGLSKGCDTNINTLVANIAAHCDPREMFTIFFEVINMYTKPHTLHFCLPLLYGLAIVFPRIRRRRAEFVKEAIPGLLEVGRVAFQAEEDSEENDDIHKEMRGIKHIPTSQYCAPDNFSCKVINTLTDLGKVMSDMCDALDNNKMFEIHAVYLLRLLAILNCRSSTIEGEIPEGVLDIMKLLSCSKDYIRVFLISSHLEEILSRFVDEDGDEVLRARLEARIGAALAVYWGIRDGPPTATEVSDLLREQNLSFGCQDILQTINMASILLVPVGWNCHLSFQQKGLVLITSVLEVFRAMPGANCFMEQDDIPLRIMPALQRLQFVIVHSSDSMLRRQAYALLIKIIKQALPAPGRFETLQVLITNCDHPSLVSLLLTCVKDEIVSAWPSVLDARDATNSRAYSLATSAATRLSPFISPQVLQIIHGVLCTDKGDLVELPTNIDSVVSALNLYRFLLIRESSGKTNHTKVLCHEELVKGRTHWLLPMREQVVRVRSLLARAGTDVNADMLLGLDCLQSVLHRCLEIVDQVEKEIRW